MDRYLVLIVLAGYFLVLLFIAWLTGRKANNMAFFLGNKKSPWPVVAIGMIGALISGVTFVSVPGWVGESRFGYMQMVLGYTAGYGLIAFILLPVYYKLNLTSIYTYLRERFGFWTYHTGAWIFLVSRTIGTAFRLFLMAGVLQIILFGRFGIPFTATVVITILLIWLYTFKGGIKTIIWTDSLQAILFITSAILVFSSVLAAMGWSFAEAVTAIRKSEFSQIFFFDHWQDKQYFVKQFFSGMFIAIVMTGLDQDMMQKNLSCRNIRDAQKNMILYSILLIPVNLLFLSIGAILYMYAAAKGISLPARSDDLFPLIATTGGLPYMVSVVFILGVIAAAYSSADSALTALTTSFTLDILNAGRLPEEHAQKLRKRVHVGISVVLVLIILGFKLITNSSIISAIFTVAGYTYGPLLGLFTFGLFTRWKINDALVPYIAIISPVLCFGIDKLTPLLFNGYSFGFELLIVNGLITFCGLLLIREKK